MPENASAPSTAALTVFRFAALFTFLAVATGAVVCATGSGASCPTWVLAVALVSCLGLLMAVAWSARVTRVGTLSHEL